MRFNPFVSLFAASLIAFLPVHAVAQETTSNPDNTISVRDRDRSELEPRGARVGGFRLDASLDFEVTSTDNLFAEASEPVGTPDDDIIYTVAPRARLGSTWSRHALSFEAGGAFRSHEDFSTEDVDTHYAGASGRIDIGVSTDIHGSARFAHEFTPRADPDITSAGAPVEFDRTDASLGASHHFGRFRARADVSQSERRYDGAASFRDYDQSAVSGRLDVEVSPRIGLVLRGTADERDYETLNLDSEGTTGLVGVTIDGNLMRGELSVGAFEREYDDPMFGTVDGLAVSGELEWYITQLTTVTLDARRSAGDNSSVSEPYVTMEYGARVDHELLRNLVVSAGVTYGERDYEVIAREDEYVRAEVGVDYWLNRRVALRARYGYDDVDSTVPTRDFEVNAVTVGVSLRL